MALPPTFVPEFHDEGVVSKLKYERLGKTDMIVSNLSLGGAPFGSFYSPMDQDQVNQVVFNAVKSGVNFIDTAPFYNNSEEKLGVALKQLPREAFYLATKFGRYPKDTKDMFDFTKAKLIASVEESLKRLNVDYIDLLQMHDVEFCISLDQLIYHTLPAMLELKASGKIRYIGVNAYNIGLLKRIINLAPPNTIDTVLSYARLTLFNKDLAESLRFFADRGVGVINASPVGFGLLSGGEFLPSWHPAPNITKAVALKAHEYADQKGFNLASLAVKWGLNYSGLPTCLVGASNLEVLEENLKLATHPVTNEEVRIWKEIDEKFFKHCPMTQWENIDVAKYWSKMEQNHWSQNVDDV